MTRSCYNRNHYLILTLRNQYHNIRIMGEIRKKRKSRWILMTPKVHTGRITGGIKNRKTYQPLITLQDLKELKKCSNSKLEHDDCPSSDRISFLEDYLIKPSIRVTDTQAAINRVVKLVENDMMDKLGNMDRNMNIRRI